MFFLESWQCILKFSLHTVLIHIGHRVSPSIERFLEGAIFKKSMFVLFTWFITRLFLLLSCHAADEDGSVRRALQSAVEHQRCPQLGQGQPGPDQNV